MALVATAGAANSNSYLTLAEANTYFEGRLHTTVWTAATDPQKEAALIWATRLIDSEICFIGEASGATQALAWPRSGMTNRNGFDIADNVVPNELKYATAELALLLLSSDRTLESEAAAAGLSRLKAGPVELGFKDEIKSNPVPDGVRTILVKDWLCPEEIPWVGIV